jgi:excisionase family DNA binding protein
MVSTGSDELLSPSDAARILELTPAAVVAMARRGVLPCMRTAGGRRLFSRLEVENLAARRATAREPRR